MSSNSTLRGSYLALCLNLEGIGWWRIVLTALSLSQEGFEVFFRCSKSSMKRTLLWVSILAL